jgi:hypothetical protein
MHRPPAFRFFGRVDRNRAFSQKKSRLLVRLLLIFRFFGPVDPNLAFRERKGYIHKYSATRPPVLYCLPAFRYFFGRVDRNLAFSQKSRLQVRLLLILRCFGRVDPNLASREKDKVYTRPVTLAPPVLHCPPAFRFFGRVDRNLAFSQKRCDCCPPPCTALPACL